MVKRSWPKPKAVAAFIVGSCVIVSLFDEPSSPFSSPTHFEQTPTQFESSPSQIQSSPPQFESSPTPFLRRVLSKVEALVSEEPSDTRSAIYPWAKNVQPLSVTPNPSNETVLFWHIPKSGGSTAKAIYRCLGKRLDIESRPESILNAKKIDLIPSGKVDILFSSFPNLAIETLFHSAHKARVLAMFRHPVDRLVSKFYYLQIASWERTYRPEWKDMDILVWAKEKNKDNNAMVKKLAGKVQRMKATGKDLRLAKRTIESRFVVGLMQEMEESIRRFNIVMDIDETETNHEACMKQYFGSEGKKKNFNVHPIVERDSPAWQLLATQNSYDIQLYEYILELFEEQKEIIDSYSSAIAVTPT